jgi:hypothetical protein
MDRFAQLKRVPAGHIMGGVRPHFGTWPFT